MTQAAPQKAKTRKAALSARDAIATPARRAAIARALIEALAPHAGRPLSGYLPIRSEADPVPAMSRHHAAGAPVGVPVVTGRGRPLAFRLWEPGCALVRGDFGVSIPQDDRPMTPAVLIVPMAAFDERGYRLGYGGGFYDRTLEMLRARGPIVAVGLAYAGQEVAQVPTEPTDQPLDAIVTEEGLRHF